MKKLVTWMFVVTFLLGVATIAVTPNVASAQAVAPTEEQEGDPEIIGEEVAEEEGEICGICESKSRIHEALPWLQLGADFRVRGIYQDNAAVSNTDPTGERFWQRIRTRVWAQIEPIENIDVNVRLVNEWRNYCRPEGGLGSYRRSTNFDEILIDKLNVQWNRPFDLPATVTIGRQDIALGDRWLVFEGTPLDGSRTIYFDAARATFDIKDYKSRLDLIYIDQAADPDKRIPPINDRERLVTNQNERGAIVWFRNSQIERTTLDGFFIWKHDMTENGTGNDSDLYTFGGRLATDINENWAFRATAAPQFGEKNDQSIEALGVNSRLTYSFNDDWNNQLYAHYEFRSGGETPNENFDILWGRYPSFSNIYQGYADGLEGQIAALSNFHRAEIGYKTEPIEDVQFTAVYDLLFAHRNNLSNTANFSDGGKFRGQLFGAIVKQTLSEHIDHHLIGEVFIPGNYYSDNRNDTAVFARYQIMFKW